MKKLKLNRTVEMFISVVVAVEVGTFFTNLLVKTNMNVWGARFIGCGICILAVLFIDQLFRDKKRSK